MKLIPLLDRTGNTRAWADRRTGWIANLAGRVFALVAWDGFFDRTGAQIGWWHGDYVYDRYGRVVLFRVGRKIGNLNIPRSRPIPPPPKVQLPPAHPTLRWLLPPPLTRRSWVDFTSFFGALGYPRTAVEKLRDFRERVERRIG
jgi:hypothetical protein